MTTGQPQIARSQSTARRVESDNSERVFAVSALLVTPLAFTATLLLALPAGATNAAIIALVPALFSAAFFGGLRRLAIALKQDERMVLPANATNHHSHPAPASRAA